MVIVLGLKGWSGELQPGTDADAGDPAATGAAPGAASRPASTAPAATTEARRTRTVTTGS